ncbi:MAG: hypothetical protein ACREPC_06195, partial [Stenotrophomonas sp.]
MQASSQVNRAGAIAAHSASNPLPAPRPKRFTSSPLDVRTLLTNALPLLFGCLLGQWLPTISQVTQLHHQVLWLPGPL